MSRCRQCGYGVDSPCECEPEEDDQEPDFDFDNDDQRDEDAEWGGMDIPDTRY